MAAEQSRRRQIAEQPRKQFRRRQIAEQPRKRQIIEQPRSPSGIAQATSLKKLLMIGAAVTGAVTGAALVVKRLASSAGGLDFERLIERMPETLRPSGYSTTSARSGRTRSASCKCLKETVPPPGLSRRETPLHLHNHD